MSIDNPYHNPVDPRADLAAWIAHEQSTGAPEVDPYSYAMVVIRTALEFALDDGIVGSMNHTESATLGRLANVIQHLDPASAPEVAPR